MISRGVPSVPAPSSAASGPTRDAVPAPAAARFDDRERAFLLRQRGIAEGVLGGLEAMSIGQFWIVVDEHATGRAGDLDLSADPAAREHTLVEARLRELAGGGVTLGELAGRG